MKVLGKKIAPGQEHLDVLFEALAVRNCFSDHSTKHTSYMVYVCGGESAIKELSVITAQCNFSGMHHYVWGFPSRASADHFVSMLWTIPNLSFWLVGISNEYAPVAQFPLLGFFRPQKYRDEFHGPESIVLKTERMRAKASYVLEEFHHQVDISAIFVSREIMYKTHLAIHQGSKPMLILDHKKSKPEKLIYKPAERAGMISISCEDYRYFLFQDPSEARAYFTQAASCNIGFGWHFGLDH